MRYTAALDGIRGIAIVTVCLAHYGLPILQRGGFGVDVFFTLSGFLITSILLGEYSRSGDIGFRNFYIRRLLRLFPALFCLLIVYGTLVTLFGKNLSRHFGDIALVFFYVANWAGAAGLNRPGELGHTWSLSVEEQFYFLWPIILYAVVKKWGGKGLLVTSLTLTLLSMSETFIMSTSVPWWRLYYGFDTRAFTLLFGCCLAIAFHFWNHRVVLPKPLEAVLPLLSFGGIALFMLRRDAFTADPGFFSGPIFIIPVLTCGLIYLAVKPGFNISKSILSTKPLVYFGKRSYGLYLWHYWILNVTNPKNIPVLLACAAASLVVTELSFRFIEMPFLSLKHRFAKDEAPAPAESLTEPAAA
ncbi:acyltransferase [Geomonas paludis]|uniref:Acyltransferase n=1 Tax=Geomonas paludis TaxID=2740185 RepID=A0ABY4LG94_9BACT|nr:acyltransferase [Geomonas paludis]UPU36769.1 acyltransferase [Geomonas paludis]